MSHSRMSHSRKILIRRTAARVLLIREAKPETAARTLPIREAKPETAARILLIREAKPETAARVLLIREGQLETAVRTVLIREVLPETATRVIPVRAMSVKKTMVRTIQNREMPAEGIPTRRILIRSSIPVRKTTDGTTETGMVLTEETGDSSDKGRRYRNVFSR